MIEKYLPAWAQEKIAGMIEEEIEKAEIPYDGTFKVDVETDPNILGLWFGAIVSGRAYFNEDGDIDSFYFNSVLLSRGYSFDKYGDLYKEHALNWEEIKEFQKLF